MLEVLMAEIKEGGTLQPAALAARLNISVGLVLMMFEDLERRGMLTRLTSDCNDSCGGCPVSGVCGTQGQPQGRIWILK
jgi:hypothetical protein